MAAREYKYTGQPAPNPGRWHWILKAGLAMIICLTLMFIALPVASLFLKSPLDATLRSLGDPMVKDALRLSMMTSALTTMMVVIMGTPIAYISARYHYPGKGVVDAITHLPVIMPPAVLGQYLNTFGISIAFTTLAVIMAQVFVSSPFYIRQAKTSFEDVDLALENAARTLGASRLYTFIYVILPLAMNGMISGAITAFARSLGEFGATIMFAGNFQGRTQTMPLAIYTAMQGDLGVALCLSQILVVISFLIIALVEILARRMCSRC